MRLRLLLVLLLGWAGIAGAWTVGGGYNDSKAPLVVYLSAGGCVGGVPGSAWDLYSTNPLPACLTGTVIKKGVLTFDHTNTCASTTATIGCAFQTFSLPTGFASAGVADIKLFFLSTGTTSTQTIKWTVATKCTTPVTGAGGGTVDNPAALNPVQTLTYTNSASEVGTGDGSLRTVTQAGLTTTGCTAGDVFHIRIGRDITDTVTSSVYFVGAELTLYVAR